MKAQVEGFMPLSEACRRLCITRQALYVAIKKSKLMATKVGNKYFVTQKDLNDYTSNRYNRDLRKQDGEYLFDIKKGNLSISQAAKFVSVALGHPCNLQRIYYLVRTGQIKASQKGCAWIVDKASLFKFIEREKKLVIGYGSGS